MKILYIGDIDLKESIEFLLSEAIPGASLDYLEKKSVRSEKSIAEIIRKKYDVVILPLMLPFFNSLRIAERVHQGKLNVRLVLHSATSIAPEKLVPLFDAFVPKLFGFDDLMSTVKSVYKTKHHPRISNQNQLKRLLTAVLEEDTWGGPGAIGRHGRSASMSEYQAKEEEMKSGLKEDRNPTAHPLLRLTILGAFSTGIALAAFGVFLVYLGSSGNSEFDLLGQSFQSANVGVASIFIGAVLVIFVVRRALKSHDRHPT